MSAALDGLPPVRPSPEQAGGRSPLSMLVRRNAWPLAAALVLLGTVLAWLSELAIERAGAFTYALDDAYIHMAIAKNFAAGGVWGVTRDAFASSSSSPLWTLLLAALYALMGPLHDLPLWLNVVSAAALLAVAFAAVGRELPPAGTLAVLVALVLLVPLVPLVLVGMEHVLHAALALAFVTLAADAIAADAPPPRGWLVATAFLAAAVRFETGFLVAPACGMLLLRRRPRLALEIGTAAALPVLLLGAVNVANGWPFLPVSILLKVQRAPGEPVWGRLGAIAAAVIGAPHVTWLIACAAVLLVVGMLRGRRPLRDPRQAALAVVAVAAMLHLAFARVGWLYRYEAYLLVLALVAVARSSWVLLRPIASRALAGAAFAVALAIAILPLPVRALNAHLTTLYATINIREQQVQMASFLAAHYRGATVAANDIGAIGWYADVSLLDTFGLASLEVASAKRSGTFSGRMVETLASAKGVEIAVVYPDWLDPVPPLWRPVGYWRIQDNHVCAFDVVVFFAVAPGSDEKLRRSLGAFAGTLPRTVEWGLYTR